MKKKLLEGEGRLTANQVMLDATSNIEKTPDQKAEAILIVLNDLTVREWKILIVYMQEAPARMYGPRAVHLLEVLARVWGKRKSVGMLADLYFAKEKDIKIKAQICDALRNESQKGSGLERTSDLFFAITSDQFDWVNYIFDNWDTYSYQGYLLAKQR
ncbi:MAG: hypothetical protein BroJett025_09480 [Patescibacteria group bacterium]|nr:MAG: hypothetical protein BroJett025_09480 [Patescibacteria group bacterium]